MPFGGRASGCPVAWQHSLNRNSLAPGEAFFQGPSSASEVCWHDRRCSPCSIRVASASVFGILGEESSYCSQRVGRRFQGCCHVLLPSTITAASERTGEAQARGSAALRERGVEQLRSAVQAVQQPSKAHSQGRWRRTVGDGPSVTGILERLASRHPVQCIECMRCAQGVRACNIL